jgi:Fe-S-cluster formation regulator IscX/YfhJ
MKAIKILFATILILTTLSACSSSKIEGPTHKARASACLVTPSVQQPGSPDKDLGFDLVEAKVVYGLNAREVEVRSNSSSEQIEELLFTSLQSGCVYFVDSDPKIAPKVIEFVGNHKYVVALIVGEEPPIDQPANVRWVADDFTSGAALAGFAAAARSTTDNVYLVVEDNFFSADKVTRAFKTGVAAFNQQLETKVDLTVLNVKSSSQLEDALKEMNSQVVVAVFAGSEIWKILEESEIVTFLGADLQLGQSTDLDLRVIASVERNFNSAVLSTAKDLFDKKFNLDPALVQRDALLNGFIELTPKDDTVFDATISDLINGYKARILTAKAS